MFLLRIRCRAYVIAGSLFAAVTGLGMASGYADQTAIKPSSPSAEARLPGNVAGTSGLRMRMPEMDPMRGRALFVSKGCVTCHSINGVGGQDATAFDAHTMDREMNPFEFSAKMWRVAPYMIAAQEDELGEQILFSGDELADIIAFIHDDEAQHTFGEGDLTPEARETMGGGDDGADQG